MISTKMFSSVTFLYLAGTVLYFNFLAFRSEQLGKVATALSWATLLIHTAAILWRWVESYQLGMGHAPFPICTSHWSFSPGASPCSTFFGKGK